MSLVWIVIFLLFGFFLLVKAAELLVDGAAGLAKRHHIPAIIIGLTLVAFGTSAPEAAVSILASIQQNGAIAIGNIIGSNIANIALIIGLMAMIKTIPLRQSTVTRGIPLNILAALVMLILGFDVFFQNGSTVINRFSFGDGLVLLLLFMIFLYYVYADLKVADVLKEEVEKKERRFFRDKPPMLVAMIFRGLAGLLVGGKLVVDNAAALASMMGISEAVIGITVVAIGTSLPELVTSIVAMQKKEHDIAVGNIVGSNVFNIFLVLGMASVINPIEMDSMLVYDALIMIAFTLMLFALSFKRKELSRIHGILFLACYLSYFVFLVLREFSQGALPG